MKVLMDLVEIADYNMNQENYSLFHFNLFLFVLCYFPHDAFFPYRKR